MKCEVRKIENITLFSIQGDVVFNDGPILVHCGLKIREVSTFSCIFISGASSEAYLPWFASIPATAVAPSIGIVS